MSLNKKHKQFCIEYVKNVPKFNGTKAYLQVYDCTEHTARKNSSKLLTKTDIQDEIQRLIDIKYDESDMDIKRLLKLIIKDATYDIKDVLSNQQVKKIDEDGNEYVVDVVALKDWDEIDGTLISEIKQTKDGIQVKLPDRQKAKEQIARHFGMFVDRHEHTGKDGDRLQIEVIIQDTDEKKNSSKPLPK